MWIWISASLLQFCHKLWFLFLPFSFAVYFLFSGHIYSGFMSRLFAHVFCFYNLLTLFSCGENFRQSLQETTKIFSRISFLKDLYNPFNCFSWPPSCWGHASFNQPGATTHWGLQTLSFICRPFWIFSFVLVLVCILQGDSVYVSLLDIIAFFGCFLKPECWAIKQKKYLWFDYLLQSKTGDVLLHSQSSR